MFILVMSYSAWLPGMSSFQIPSFVIAKHLQEGVGSIKPEVRIGRILMMNFGGQAYNSGCSVVHPPGIPS